MRDQIRSHDIKSAYVMDALSDLLMGVRRWRQGRRERRLRGMRRLMAERMPDHLRRDIGELR